jgi:hypothetical protein
MERLWSRAVATGRNRSQMERPRKPLKEAKSIAFVVRSGDMRSRQGRTGSDAVNSWFDPLPRDGGTSYQPARRSGDVVLRQLSEPAAGQGRNLIRESARAEREASCEERRMKQPCSCSLQGVA